MWTGRGGGVTVNQSPQLCDGDLVEGPGWHLLSCIHATVWDGDSGFLTERGCTKMPLQMQPMGVFSLHSLPCLPQGPKFQTDGHGFMMI